MNNTYGHCKLNDENKQCECLKNQWLGQACPNWISISFLIGEEIREWYDLLKYAKKIKEQNDTKD